MNPEILERIEFYITSTRRVSLVAAQNLHANGHHEVARQHENEAAYAALILKDLSEEKNVGV